MPACYGSVIVVPPLYARASRNWTMNMTRCLRPLWDGRVCVFVPTRLFEKFFSFLGSNLNIRLLARGLLGLMLGFPSKWGSAIMEEKWIEQKKSLKRSSYYDIYKVEMKSLYLLSLCKQNFNLYKHPRYIYEYFSFSFSFGDGFSSLQNGNWYYYLDLYVIIIITVEKTKCFFFFFFCKIKVKYIS